MYYKYIYITIIIHNIHIIYYSSTQLHGCQSPTFPNTIFPRLFFPPDLRWRRCLHGSPRPHQCHLHQGQASPVGWVVGTLGKWTSWRCNCWKSGICIAKVNQMVQHRHGPWYVYCAIHLESVTRCELAKEIKFAGHPMFPKMMETRWKTVSNCKITKLYILMVNIWNLSASIDGLCCLVPHTFMLRFVDPWVKQHWLCTRLMVLLYCFPHNHPPLMKPNLDILGRHVFFGPESGNAGFWLP